MVLRRIGGESKWLCKPPGIFIPAGGYRFAGATSDSLVLGQLIDWLELIDKRICLNRPDPRGSSKRTGVRHARIALWLGRGHQRLLELGSQPAGVIGSGTDQRW